MNALRKTNRVLYNASKYAIAGVLIVLTIAVSYQVLSRYIAAVPRIMWTEELSRAGLIWLVFLGASFAYYESAHFRIELLPAKLSRTTLLNIERVSQVIVFITIVLLTIGSFTFFQSGFGRTSVMSHVSLAWSYLAVAVSFSIILLRAAEELIGVFTPSTSRQHVATQEEEV
ncbi:TRAP transporter small permease [Microbacterium sp. YY-01]|uniref:TRAP transporter small permease n=1 Tax=Microbacterium sp. YY-01 TaxID=3421634 RepID=UPI003D164286